MLKLTTIFINLVSNEPTYPKLNFPSFLSFCNNLKLLTKERTPEEEKALEEEASNADAQRKFSRMPSRKSSTTPVRLKLPKLLPIDVAECYAHTLGETIVNHEQAPPEITGEFTRREWARKAVLEELQKG